MFLLFQLKVGERISKIDLNKVSSLTDEQRKALKPLIDQVNVIKNKETVTVFSKMFTSEATEVPNIKLALSPAEVSEIKKVLKGFGYDFTLTPETDREILGEWDSKYSGMDNGAVKFSEWANNPHVGMPSIRKGKPIQESTATAGGYAPETISERDMNKPVPGVGSFARSENKTGKQQPASEPKIEKEDLEPLETISKGESGNWLKTKVFTSLDGTVSNKWEKFEKALNEGKDTVKLEQFGSSQEIQSEGETLGLKDNFNQFAKEKGYVMEIFQHKPSGTRGFHKFDITFARLEKAKFDIDGIQFNKSPAYKVGKLLNGEEVEYVANMEDKVKGSEKTRSQALLDMINERSAKEYRYTEGYPEPIGEGKNRYKVKLELFVQSALKLEGDVKKAVEENPGESSLDEAEQEIPAESTPPQPPATGATPAVPGVPSAPSAGLSLGLNVGSKKEEDRKKKAESMSDEELQSRISEYKKKILGSENKSQELSAVSNVLDSQSAKNELTSRDKNKIKKELELMVKFAFSPEQIQQLKAGESVNLDKHQINAISKAEGGVNTAVTDFLMQLDASKVKDVSFNPKFDKKNSLESLEVKSFFKTDYPTEIKVKPEEKKTQAEEDKSAPVKSDLDELKEEIKEVDYKIKELKEKEQAKPKVSGEDSKKFYKDIGLNSDKQDYFFGNIAFGSSKVNTENKSFNTAKSIDDLKLYLPPAVSEKLSGRPGVTEVKQEEWKEKNGEFNMGWIFKVNNNAHSLNFTVGKPNEKGFRKVTLLFE